jgi:hypothetical protein
MPSGALPKNARSGGSSASTIRRTASAEAVGSPGVLPARRCFDASCRGA